MLFCSKQDGKWPEIVAIFISLDMPCYELHDGECKFISLDMPCYELHDGECKYGS